MDFSNWDFFIKLNLYFEISKIYDIKLQRYRDWKIRIWLNTFEIDHYYRKKGWLALITYLFLYLVILESYSAGHADLVTKVKNLSGRLDQILGKQVGNNNNNNNNVNNNNNKCFISKPTPQKKIMQWTLLLKMSKKVSQKE